MPPAASARAEDGHVGIAERVRQLHQLQAEAKIRLVRAVARHGLFPAQTGKGRLQLDSLNLAEYPRHHALDHGEDVLGPHEGHLDVELGELGLPVHPQVLVAKAAHHLEVAVHPSHHEDLLKELGRLRQGVELARMHPAGDQVVAGTLGRTFGEDGGFDLHERQAVQVIADGRQHAMADLEGAQAARPPQVEIAVPETAGLRRLDVVIDRERRHPRGIEHPQLLRHKLHRAGGEIRVDRFLGTPDQ